MLVLSIMLPTTINGILILFMLNQQTKFDLSDPYHHPPFYLGGGKMAAGGKGSHEGID